jgi:hypothetical protein
MTLAELQLECARVREQGLEWMIVIVERKHRRSIGRVRVLPGVFGQLVGSDRRGMFASVRIDDVERFLERTRVQLA